MPGLTFETQSDQTLTGCQTFDGSVRLTGRPLGRFRGYTVGAIDTIVERKQDLVFGADPQEDVTVTTPIELVALHLGALNPIQIQCDQGVTLWDVDVEVDPSTGDSLGQMDVTLEHPDLTGGTASSGLQICPRVTFTRVDSGGSGSFEIYPCDLLCGPELFGETSWGFELPDGTVPILAVDGLTTDNFFFLESDSDDGAQGGGEGEAPQSSASRVPTMGDFPDPGAFEMVGQVGEPAPASADECGSVNPDGSCKCGFLYPHLSENHRHQACGPCPCDADQGPPSVFPPSSPSPPFECDDRRNGKGSIPSDHPDVVAWLEDVTCTDDMSAIDSCQAENYPIFFDLGPGSVEPPNACLGATPVQFIGKDECCNETVEIVDILVQDTTPPNVSSDDPDSRFGCLGPPNGGVVCFDQDAMPSWPFDFEFNEILSTYTSDLCSNVVDWVFTSCSPEDGDEQTGDCVIPTDGRSFCVKARKGPNGTDRDYRIGIKAIDECGNVGEPMIIGKVHVPRNPKPPNDPDPCVPVEPCTVTCSAEPTSGEAPLTVGFDFQANGPANGACDFENATFTWDFGDGTTSSDAGSASHEYAAGTYQPMLTLTRPDVAPVTAQCPEIQSKKITPSCAADPSVGLVPLAVNFTDGSTAVGTTITSWEWDFGDGATSTDQNPSRTFGSVGVYNVELTVSDADGYSETTTCPVSVVSLEALCSADPASGVAPLSVSFMDESQAGGTAITAWSWDFMDGNTSTEQNPNHVFAADGTYEVMLTVTDQNGLTDTNTCTVTVSDLDLSCTASPDTGETPLTVSFTSAANIGITAWDWDFGDGATSTEEAPTHEFTDAGIYPVALTVTDVNGVQHTTTCPVTAAATCFVDLGTGGGVNNPRVIDVAEELGLDPDLVTVLGITQDEPVSMDPDNDPSNCGNKTPDGCFDASGSSDVVHIRLESCADGNGRFYHIEVDVPDGVVSPCGGSLVVCKEKGNQECEDPNNDGPQDFDSTNGGEACPWPTPY